MIDDKQILNKNNVLVKDDFFDDIVNGLKSPIDEVDDKRKADVSRITFTGKQLQRFKKGVVPILANNLSKGNIIHIYIQETEGNYWRKRIKEIKETIDSSQNEIEVIEEDVEDELDDLKDDKEGLFKKVITKGRAIWNITSFVLRFYGYYKRVRGMFDSSKIELSEKQYGFNITNYDFSKEIDREKAADEFILYLNTTLLDRFKMMMSPMMYNMTKLILAATDMAFHKINLSIYIMVAKEVMLLLADIALTLALAAATAALSWTGVGGAVGAAATAAKALRVANRVRKLANMGRNIYKAIMNVKRIGKVVNTLRRGFNVVKKSRTVRRTGERAVNFLRRAKAMPRRDRSAALNRVHRQIRRIDRAGELADAGFVIFDLVTIDREEAYAEREQLRAVSAKFGSGAVRALDKLQRNLEASYRAEIKTSYTEKLFKKVSESSGADIENVTETGLDFDAVGLAIEKLSKKFEIPQIEILKPQRKSPTSFLLDGYTIDATNGTLEFTSGGQMIKLENKFKDETINILKRAGVVREGIVKLAKENGHTLGYDRDGYINTVWMKFISRDIINKITIKNDSKYVDVASSSDNSSDDGRVLSLEIRKKDQAPQEIQTIEFVDNSKKDITLKDLSEIITPRNTQLEKEKQILKHIISLENALCNPS